MSFAFDIETEPNFELLDKQFVHQPFVDTEVPREITKLKTAKLREERTLQWQAEAVQREELHHAAEEARYQKLLEKSTLRAEQSRVVCISYCDKAGPIICWSEGDEKQLLRLLWKDCLDVQRNGGSVYTMSGTQFDIRYCARRSFILDMQIPTGLKLFSFNGPRPYLSKTFVDVAEVYSFGEYSHKCSVNDLALACGIPPKVEGISGADFWRIYKTDRELAETYAKRDAKIAWELGCRLRHIGIHPAAIYPEV